MCWGYIRATENKKYMDPEEFKKFVDASIGENQAQQEKKQARIDFYLSELDKLYHLIDEDWIADYIANETIKTEIQPIQITEEELGEYTANKKYIIIGGYRLCLEPVGTYLIGAKGRVDLKYKNNSYKFILIGENINQVSDLIDIRIRGQKVKSKKDPGNLVWKYVNNSNSSVLRGIDKDIFQKLLMAVIDEKYSF